MNKVNENLRELLGVTDIQWRGDAITNIDGSNWQLRTGDIVKSKKYICFYGGGEVIAYNGNETVAEGEIIINGEVTFSIFGLIEPKLKCHFQDHSLYFDSDEQSPKLFDTYFKDYLNYEVFKSHFGQLFIKRIKECLNYNFDEEKYLGDK